MSSHLGPPASHLDCPQPRLPSACRAALALQAADTRVGDAKTRGLSGGERKRLSIAVELISSPALLFADEPTSGLDAFSAEKASPLSWPTCLPGMQHAGIHTCSVPPRPAPPCRPASPALTDLLQVMQTLKQLCGEGHTVLVSIHQPRSSVFAAFDDLILMAGGCPVCGVFAAGGVVVLRGSMHEGEAFFLALTTHCSGHGCCNLSPGGCCCCHLVPSPALRPPSPAGLHLQRGSLCTRGPQPGCSRTSRLRATPAPSTSTPQVRACMQGKGELRLPLPVLPRVCPGIAPARANVPAVMAPPAVLVPPACLSCLLPPSLSLPPFNLYTALLPLLPCGPAAEWLADLVAIDHSTPESEQESRQRLQQLTAAWRKVAAATAAEGAAEDAAAGAASNGGNGTASSGALATSGSGGGQRGCGLVRQVQLLFQRSLRQVLRDRATNIGRASSQISSALVFSSIYWRMSRSQSSIQDRMGLLQVSCVGTAMTSLIKTLSVFPRCVHAHDMSAGMYACI